jgi:hypothetical protein
MYRIRRYAHPRPSSSARSTDRLKMGYTADLLFPTACSLTKISLCLTYYRLFPGRMDKIFCWSLSIFVILYTVACLFLSLFQCTPIKGYWDPSVKLKCINMRATLVSMAAMNSLSDFLVYLVSRCDLYWRRDADRYKYPIKPLWSLRLPVKQRIGLIFLFSVGLLVCVVGVLRMYYLEVYFSSYDTLCRLRLHVQNAMLANKIQGMPPRFGSAWY